MKDIQIPFPILVGKEGKWFVASCPALDIALNAGHSHILGEAKLLRDSEKLRFSRNMHEPPVRCNIATQGKTEQEVKENMRDLINEYLNDPDTVKPE